MNLVEHVRTILTGPDKAQAQVMQGCQLNGKKICPRERAKDIHEHATEQLTITTRKAKAIAAQAQNLLEKGI
jgi:hypothetical protein